MNKDMRVTMTNMKLEQETIVHSKLPDAVLDQLMDWIMDGKLHMGEKLNTEELANKLGVSRMPIREAIGNLEKKGLAESIPYVGTRLVKLTEEDVSQIYLARKALEPVVGEFACAKVTEEGLERLEKINEEYKTIVRQKEVNAKDVYRQNRYYHFTIYSMSGLDRLCAMIESLWDSLSFFKLIYGQKFLSDGEHIEKMIQEHTSYLDALRERNGEKLHELLKKNLGKRTLDIPYSSVAYFASEEK